VRKFLPGYSRQINLFKALRAHPPFGRGLDEGDFPGVLITHDDGADDVGGEAVSTRDEPARRHWSAPGRAISFHGHDGVEDMPMGFTDGVKINNRLSQPFQ
jgi:hypothetical protein